MQICPSCGEENPARFRLCGFCGAALAPTMPAQEVRKTVTLIFVDLKGSTSLGEHLDPEALHEVKERYFAAMAAEITRHGGKIEKYIGDAIMAVFGLPRAHEDDALRAVRAAHGMQATLASLNRELFQVYGVTLANRTGVNTGEVVANVDPGADQKLATGDAVNVTARLEQAAPENEILVGEVTYSLVRDAVEVEAVEPLELKGKAERVPAYRLLSVRERVVEGRSRRDDAPMVGRKAELERLESAFDAAVAARSLRVVTIIGDAGVGKSRLIREFVTSVEDRADVVRGRCLPYGEGITFWPLLEIVREAAGIQDDDPPETARAKLLGLVAERDVAVRVASMAGLTPAQFPLPELFWGARRLLESMAARRPLVAVVDDIHWAEPTFLDLLENLVETVSDAPVVLLCSSRHDLLETRPDWGEKLGSERIVLTPLSEADASQIVGNLLGSAGLPDGVRRRIVDASEGNPLFVEQMLSMLIESGALRFDDGRWVRADESREIAVPPTIQALLTARLDQLSREERAVIQPAAVIGVQFARPAVAQLSPEAVQPQVGEHLTALTRKHLVRPEGGSEEDDTFRFGHVLVRDAAYQSLLKRSRASLHEQFVVWADQVNAERGRALEFEEILGYHLEQAYRYLAELGPVDEHGRTIGADAAGRLARAGDRAFSRGDMHAAANLFKRATALLSDHDPRRLSLLADLGEALIELGEFDRAAAELEGAIRAADEVFDDATAAHARLMRLMVEHYATAEADWTQRAIDTARHAIAVFERAQDERGLARAWRLLSAANGTALMYREAAQAAEQVIDHARRADDQRQERKGSATYALTALYGPTPVGEAIRACEEIVDRMAGDRFMVGLVLGYLAELYAMAGRFDDGRAAYQRGRGVLEELGHGVVSASTSVNSWRVEMEAGDLEAAEDELRHDYGLLVGMNEKFLLPTVAARLAWVLLAQGRIEDADTIAAVAQGLAADDDVEAQSQWRGVRARLLAAEGNVAHAYTLAAAAVDLLRPTQSPPNLADALIDRGEVLLAAGDRNAALDSFREALELYDAKGYRPAAARVRQRIDDVMASESAAV